MAKPTESDCTVCIQPKGATDPTPLRDAGRGTGVTDTYGASITSDVTNVGKPSGNFLDSQIRIRDGV
jgi:hypothetical protein